MGLLEAQSFPSSHVCFDAWSACSWCQQIDPSCQKEGPVPLS